MDFEQFAESLAHDTPPAVISDHLLALWYDGKGDWKKSHDVIQAIEDTNASWIHAYLHRKEGDIWNADYWYRKAGKIRPGHSLEMEWSQITKALIAK